MHDSVLRLLLPVRVKSFIWTRQVSAGFTMKMTWLWRNFLPEFVALLWTLPSSRPSFVKSCSDFHPSKLTEIKSVAKTLTFVIN